MTGGPGRGDSALLLAEGKPGCVLPHRRRLDYVNHARRLAEDDWADVESEEEEGEDGEEEEMDVDAGKKLPKRYANQVRSCPPLSTALQRGVGMRAGLGSVRDVLRLGMAVSENNMSCLAWCPSSAAETRCV